MLLSRRMVGRLLALLLISFGIFATNAYAAEPSSALLKAKKEAEAKGFLFAASHDEIVSKAKQEGRLRVIVSLDAGILKRLSEGFTKKYPFIQVQADEIRGIDAYTRQLQELQAGLAKGIDVNEVDYDYYNDYLPHLKKVDMYRHGRAPGNSDAAQMVDPINRNIVAVGSGIQIVTAHRQKLLPSGLGARYLGRIPETGIQELGNLLWEFVPKTSPRWCQRGVLKRTLDFAASWRRKNPIWVSGDTRTITNMLAGEYALSSAPTTIPF